MKATFANGITVEGTPTEVAEFKRLLDEQAAIKYKPPYTAYPWWNSSVTYVTSPTVTYTSNTNPTVKSFNGSYESA